MRMCVQSGRTARVVHARPPLARRWSGGLTPVHALVAIGAALVVASCGPIHRPFWSPSTTRKCEPLGTATTLVVIAATSDGYPIPGARIECDGLDPGSRSIGFTDEDGAWERTVEAGGWHVSASIVGLETRKTTLTVMPGHRCTVTLFFERLGPRTDEGG
jgi:hypothetical protein